MDLSRYFRRLALMLAKGEVFKPLRGLRQLRQIISNLNVLGCVCIDLGPYLGGSYTARVITIETGQAAAQAWRAPHAATLHHTHSRLTS